MSRNKTVSVMLAVLVLVLSALGQATTNVVVVDSALSYESAMQTIDMTDHTWSGCWLSGGPGNEWIVCSHEGDDMPVLHGAAPRSADVTVVTVVDNNVDNNNDDIDVVVVDDDTDDDATVASCVEPNEHSSRCGNNGHGNNEDGVDSSNPGKSDKHDNDTDPTVDDEKPKNNKEVK